VGAVICAGAAFGLWVHSGALPLLLAALILGVFLVLSSLSVILGALLNRNRRARFDVELPSGALSPGTLPSGREAFVQIKPKEEHTRGTGFVSFPWVRLRYYLQLCTADGRVVEIYAPPNPPHKGGGPTANIHILHTAVPRHVSER
jgi:hypothetical protein